MAKQQDLYDAETPTPKRAKAPPVPQPPQHCMVDGCNHDADVFVLLVRRVMDDKQIAARPGAFINCKAGEWQMRKGFRFDSWVTRCGMHYAQDVEHYRG